MKKKLLTLVIATMLVSNIFFIAGNANASNYKNFDFDRVVYDWPSPQNIRNSEYVWKRNSSKGVVNTLKSAGGGVKGDYHFNTRILTIIDGNDDGKIFARVAHEWNCAPNTRTLIPYDSSASKYIGEPLAMQLSMREKGLSTRIYGSWSPDSQ